MTSSRPQWATEIIDGDPQQALGPAIITDNLTVQLDWIEHDGPGISIQDTSTHGGNIGLRLTHAQAQQLATALAELITISQRYGA